jgi:hypothetical protein
LNKRDITHPDLVGCGCAEVSVEPIRGDPLSSFGTGRHHKPFPALTIDIMVSSQSRHPIPATLNAFSQQLLPALPDAVVLTGLMMDSIDMAQ